MRMWWLSCFGFLLTVSARRDDYDRIGYFWHITDIHYDPHFTIHGDSKKENVPVPHKTQKAFSVKNFQELVREPLEPLTYNFDLKTFLESTFEGKEILQASGKFTPAIRNKLTDLLIKNELKTEESLITTARFVQLARLIKQLFPLENICTYYSPYVTNPKGNFRRTARGKLFDKYHNRRRALRGAGLLPERRQKLEETPESQIELSEDVLENCCWLENCFNPWTEVVEKWAATQEARKKFLSGDVTIDQYFNRFPALKQPLGYTLIELDFKEQFQGYDSKLFLTLPQLIPKFLINARQSKDQNIRKLLEESDAVENEGCWRHENGGSSSSSRDNKAQRRPASENLGKFGEYNCDSTWELIESAAKFMKSRQSDNVEFVLWTGDGLSHFATRHLSENHQLELVQALTDLLGKTFPVQFVFPALGHDDPPFKKHLGRMWSRWLPTDSMKTFETGGYYIIERKQLKLQYVVLNTNLMKRSESDEDATKQWRWLEKVLHKFEKNGETVYLVGHVAPGWDERQKGFFQPSHGAYTEYHNKKYIETVRNYSEIIAGQFFGHLHSDTFRIIYESNGKPISWAMVAPSVTPKRNHMGPNNPGLRLYKFNKDTGQVFDYTQYYIELSQANSNSKAEWLVEYNFTSYYGVSEISPESLNNLAKKFIIKSEAKNSVFERYYKANTVKVPPHPRDHCDLSCVHNHYCAITQVDYSGFEDCLIRTAMIRSFANRNFAYQSHIVGVLVFMTGKMYL